jgi:hypothetical protein
MICRPMCGCQKIQNKKTPARCEGFLALVISRAVLSRSLLMPEISQGLFYIILPTVCVGLFLIIAIYTD